MIWTRTSIGRDDDSYTVVMMNGKGDPSPSSTDCRTGLVHVCTDCVHHHSTCSLLLLPSLRVRACVRASTL